MAAIDVLAELTTDNPRADKGRLRLCADALSLYCEATSNVQRNGAITLHPRTASPMENPYLKIMERQWKLLLAMHGVKFDRVMGLLTGQPSPAGGKPSGESEGLGDLPELGELE